MSAPYFRTPYNDKYVDPGINFLDANGEPEKSLTVQSEKDNCDVNLIVEKFEKTGILPVMSQSPAYGDVSGAVDYQTAMNIVINAEKAFMSLDAKIRKEFDNNPGKFLDFIDDPQNADRLVEMGLREAPLPAPAEPEPKTE